MNNRLATAANRAALEFTDRFGVNVGQQITRGEQQHNNRVRNANVGNRVTRNIGNRDGFEGNQANAACQNHHHNPMQTNRSLIDDTDRDNTILVRNMG